jgi:methionyl-tRNA formyltransferase
MPKTNISILFLGKENDPYCAKALEFCQLASDSVTYSLGKWGDPLPEDVIAWEGDLIISYLSRWIVPAKLIKSAKMSAINFHPAPPEYPGVGCTNFALYNYADSYGVTCHHMNPEVDTGEIIDVKRFKVFGFDNVDSLLVRTYENQLVQFFEIFSKIISGEPLPNSEAKWTRKPFSRTELNKLSILSPDMSKDEITKRIRALNYRSWKPRVNMHGFTFEFIDNKAE